MKISAHLAIGALTFLLLPTGCSTYRFDSTDRTIKGESVVLMGQQPARLAFAPARKGSVVVRNTYQDNLPQTTTYEPGRDYVIDFNRGEIQRTLQSRLPDFRTNMLFGVEDFDHGKFPGFGNTKFFVFVDYAPRHVVDWPKQEAQAALLPKTSAKLAAGEKLKIVAYGDSITAGGDATDPKLIFWQRWADFLQQKYPAAKIEAVNGATGGDRTNEGLQRLDTKVLQQHPDLVLIGFGMNDHNIGGYGTPIETFKKNLTAMIERIRRETGAEIILYSTFPPNPKWHYGSKNMQAYATATANVATDQRCAFADVYNNWVELQSRKKPEDLLGNNINHPNDFGHWMYFKVLTRIGL